MRIYKKDAIHGDQSTHLHLYPLGRGNGVGLTSHRDVLNTRLVAIVQVIAVASVGPAVNAQGTWETKPAQESPATSARSPRPSGTALDRKVIHAESNVGEYCTHGGAKQNVEAVVAVVLPPRGGDKERNGSGHEGNYHQQDRRGRTTRADRGALAGVVATFNRVLWEVGESDRKLGS